ncbi:hypothetical protein IQ06DRAFT_352017 [Phaeosphaeriaceae sp. SRC1lsM3a]|nr:hypothetical protein IQ06DRAFT_352017 [Stagonospora sp. SRC1lsM3a]
MKLTSYLSSVLAFSTLVCAIPVSPYGKALTPRADECTDENPHYGTQITEQEYIDYLKKYYPNTDKYMLYSANSDNQAFNFQSSNAGYFYYEDFFNAGVSQHYAEAFPPHPDNSECWRMDDGEASSIAIAKVASGDVIVFGAVEWQTKGPKSFFATKEVDKLRDSIRAGTLSKITHMLKDATTREEVLATEDVDGKQSFTDGHSAGESNASGTFGDCTTTLDPPTCDIPSQGGGH